MFRSIVSSASARMINVNLHSLRDSCTPHLKWKIVLNPTSPSSSPTEELILTHRTTKNDNETENEEDVAEEDAKFKEEPLRWNNDEEIVVNFMGNK